jgi:hypothetical protein
MRNGVDHVERVAPLVDGARVLPALGYVAVERAARGRSCTGGDAVSSCLPGRQSRLGCRRGVPTPANQGLYALVGALARVEGRW